MSIFIALCLIKKKAQLNGLPWSSCKGFDTFTPISNFIEKRADIDPHNLRLWCKVNGKICQDGNTRDMVFKIPELIESVSKVMRLDPGDLILTGTPAGVGPLSHGQTVQCGLETEDRKKSQLLSLIEFKCKQIG